MVAAAAETKITTDDLFTKISPTAALPGFNVEGGSVFTNLANALNNEQLFFIRAGTVVFERPDSYPVPFAFLVWCSDLTFSDITNSSLIGYAGRCASRILAGYNALETSGAQLTFVYSKGPAKCLRNPISLGH